MALFVGLERLFTATYGAKAYSECYLFHWVNRSSIVLTCSVTDKLGTNNCSICVQMILAAALTA